MFRPLNATSLFEEELADASPVGPVGKSCEYDEDEIVASYSEALQKLGERNFQEAEGELEKLRKLLAGKTSERRKEHKLLFPVLTNLAECFSNLGKNQEAISALNDACSSNPKNPTVWFKLGCLLIKSRSVYDAIPAFREAVTNCSGIHWISLAKLCQCLFIIGLYDDCIFYCLKGLSENSFFATGHTLLLEMLKLEKNITQYNRLLRENVSVLDEQFYDQRIISECENIRKQHVDFMSNIPAPKLDEFVPNAKLRTATNQKITLSEICRYLARVCEEIPLFPNNVLIDCPLKVQKDEPINSEEVPANSTASSHRLPTTPQQTTRLSRLSAIAQSKASNQTPGASSMRTKLLKYVGQLNRLFDPFDGVQEAAAPIAVRRSSISQTSTSVEEAVRGKIADLDTSEDVRILTEENWSLRQLVKYFLDRFVEQAGVRFWEKEDSVAFCTLFLHFRKFQQLQPFNSLEDEYNMSVCEIVRVFLEASVEFLTQSTVDGHQYLASFVTPPVALDLTDEIDCLTMPSLLCSSLRTNGTVEKRKENKIRHCLLFFWLSKVTHNFQLMQLASSSCHSVLSDFPEFSTLFLGHVFRHPLWKRDEILMEMKWTNCYENLRSLSEHFESKNWESICINVAATACNIFDVSNFDLIVASDLAHYTVIYTEALLRCSKDKGVDVLLQLLTCLLDTLSSGRPAPMLKQLLSDGWQLCYQFFDKITTASRTSLVKLMISTIEVVFNYAESNSCLPFNCSGLISSLYLAFSLLNDIGNRTNLPIRLDFSSMDEDNSNNNNKKKNQLDLMDDSSSDSFDSDEDSDFAKLPIAVRFLILFHDVLAASGGGICRSDNAVYLEIIRDRLAEFVQSGAAFEEGMTKASRTFVEKQIDQCVFCQLGVTLRKTKKSTQAVEHPSNKPVQPPQELTWETGIKLFSYYKPRDLPAYDSFKGDSIPPEFANFLKKLLTLSPAKPLLSEPELEEYLGAPLLENANDFLEKIFAKTTNESETTDQKHYTMICYLLADHVVKNSAFTDAIELYKTAIRFQPTLFDAWAGMALSWQSSVSSTLDECDREGQTCDPEIIQPVVRSFQMANGLEANNGKLLMEYASFAYDIYSLLRRVEASKKRRSKNFEIKCSFESIVAKFVGRADVTDQDLLKMVLDLFSQANNSSDIDPPSDRWFCLYMLGKLGLKLEQGIVKAVQMFVQALELLFEHEAVFPPRSTVNSKDPPRHAVECFELFYRLHTDILKFLANDDVASLQQNEHQPEESEIGLKIDQVTSLVCRVYSKRFSSVPVFADFSNDRTGLESSAGNSSVLTKAKELAIVCIQAIVFCSNRFPEHFLSRYRIANAFFEHPILTNPALCGHVLLGWALPAETEEGPFAGTKFGGSLFDPRKIQSGSVGAMLTGFWRSPHPDFDRRGCFFAHTQKCVRLLLQFLSTCQSNPDALKLLSAAHAQLARPATGAKKFLRDTDQSSLALKSLESTVDMMSTSLSVDAPCPREKLLEVYRLQQSIVRGGFVSLIDKISNIMIGCYLLSDDPNRQTSDSPPTVQEVEDYCMKLIQQEKALKAKADKARRMSVSAGTSSTITTAVGGEADREVETLLRSLIDTVVEKSQQQ